MAVDEGEGETVCEEGAELFHEIEREGVAAGAGLVEEAGLRVEANGFTCGAAVVGEEDVEKGEEGVGAVERGAFGAAFQGESGIIACDETIEDGEVGGGGFAFNAAEEIKGGGAEGGGNAFCEEIRGAGECVGSVRRFCAVVAGGALEDGPGVVQLRGDHVLRDGKGGGFVIGAAVLLAAEEDVSGNAAVGAGDEFPVRGEEGNGNTVLVAAGHEAGRNGGVPAVSDDAFEVVERDAQFALAFMADFDGGSVFAEVGAFEGDVEGVEVGFHGG